MTNENDNASLYCDASTSSECSPFASQRKRRKFQEIAHDVTAYHKKPVAKTLLLPIPYIAEAMIIHKNSIENAILRDLIWAISLSVIPNTPMWVGFNSKTIIDNSEIQVIDYFPQINLSPTSYSVVQETLKHTQRIASECGQSNIIVTYDLAIAKMALQIQISEQPKFDNIFINLGSFHIQMAFFKALGQVRLRW